MRMYTESPIHAKVYIMRKDMQKVPDTYGSVITGSSNFSEAGLQNNLEFNVELKDSRDVEFALERFEEKEFDVVADVISLGKLDKLTDNTTKLDRYEYVFIDEVHRFRNNPRPTSKKYYNQKNSQRNNGFLCR